MNKIATLLVALTAAFSFSQESLSMPTEKPITYDTIYRVISDSLTIKALEDSQAFYNDSFNRLLTIISIILAIAGLAGIFNFRQVNYAKKEFAKLEEKIKSGIKELETNQIKNKVFREISKTYLTSTYFAEFTNKKDRLFLDFFHRMTFFYHILHKNEVELNEKDVAHFAAVNDFIDEYIMKKYTQTNPFNISEENSHTIGFFLLSLQDIIKYCKKVNKKTQESVLNETWQKLCTIFGGEDKAKKTIEYYENNRYKF